MSSFAGELPPSPFSSLPDELISDIIARVPRRYHPVLSCVSKTFLNHVRSPDILKTRSLLNLESLYFSFVDDESTLPNHWFTLRRFDNKNHLTSIKPLCPHGLDSSSVIAVGPEIYFFCGSNAPSSIFFIFDSRSRLFRRGPCMKVERVWSSLGFVREKIYVIGGNREEEIEVECFDLKKCIWEAGLNPKVRCSWSCAANVSLDRKVFALSLVGGMTWYDTRDGSCGRFELPNDNWWRTGVCVMQNVMYVYFARFGLMWFDTEMMLWRVVDGWRHMTKVREVGMGEYYGNLAFLWTSNVGGETREIWCRMIGLVRSKGGIRGFVGMDQSLGTVPRGYCLQHFLSVSD